MATRDIITIGHPTLRKKARKVTEFGPALRQLIDDMIETLRAAPGVGLAAPQVNISQRVVVVELPADKEEGTPAELYAFVNPEIVKTCREVEEGEEGCLSVPGYVGEVSRPTMAIIRGQDGYGKPQKVRAYDYLARIFQHEIDHLNGVLFIDRVTDPAKIRKITPEEAETATGEVAEALVLMEGEAVLMA
ncbi:MAG: peptide deformylase [Anaerolineae bacterium CG2_30_64_16]|nr:MAG: peptide deformylase [Anaerolineae bacterium CG2_30_64_16]